MRFVGSQEAGRGCNLVYVLITYPGFGSRDKFSAADDQRPFGIPFPIEIVVIEGNKIPTIECKHQHIPQMSSHSGLLERK